MVSRTRPYSVNAHARALAVCPYGRVVHSHEGECIWGTSLDRERRYSAHFGSCIDEEVCACGAVGNVKEATRGGGAGDTCRR